MSEPQRPAPLPPGIPLVPQTNTLAVVSLVVSIMSITTCCGVTSIVGAVLGHKARSQIRETGEQGDGMALGGLIVGWVGVAMLAAAVVLFVVLLAVDASTTS